MTARSVLLAMAAVSFLRGDEPLRGDETDGSKSPGDDGAVCEGSLAQRWKECDQRAQLSLAGTNPQVTSYLLPTVPYLLV